MGGVGVRVGVGGDRLKSWMVWKLDEGQTVGYAPMGLEDKFRLCLSLSPAQPICSTPRQPTKTAISTWYELMRYIRGGRSRKGCNDHPQ